MQRILLMGLAACAALALASPAFAGPAHDHGRFAAREHFGHPGAGFRFHRFAPGHFSRLTVAERENWSHGHWWHGNHHGRNGWWWFAGGAWYLYPDAVYPYPDYVSDEMAYDYAPQGYSDQSWYYCEDPQGYYPYVRECNGEWQAVPISPQARNETGYGQPPGYEGDYNRDDGRYGDGDGDDGRDMDNDDDQSGDNQSSDNQSSDNQSGDNHY